MLIIGVINNFFNFQPQAHDELFLKYFKVFKNEFLQSEGNNKKLSDLIKYTIEHQDFRQIPFLRDDIWKFLMAQPFGHDKIYQSRHFESFYLEMCNYFDKVFDINLRVLPERFEVQFKVISLVEESTIERNKSSKQDGKLGNIAMIHVDLPDKPITRAIKQRLIEFLGILSKEKIIFSIPHDFLEELENSPSSLQLGANINYFTTHLPDGFTLQYSNFEYSFDSRGKIVKSNYLDRLSACFHSTLFASGDIQKQIDKVLPKFKDFLQKTGQNEKDSNLLHIMSNINENISETLKNIDQLVKPELASLTKGFERFYKYSETQPRENAKFNVNLGNYRFFPFIFPRINPISFTYDGDSDHFLVLTANYLIFTVVEREKADKSIESYLAYDYDENFEKGKPKLVNVDVTFRGNSTFKVKLFNSIFCENVKNNGLNSKFSLRSENIPGVLNQQILHFIFQNCSIKIESDVFSYQTYIFATNCLITSSNNVELFSKNAFNTFEECVLSLSDCKIDTDTCIVNKIFYVVLNNCKFKRNFEIQHAPKNLTWFDVSERVSRFKFTSMLVMTRLNSNLTPELMMLDRKHQIKMISVALDGPWEFPAARRIIDIQNVYFHNEMCDLTESLAVKVIKSAEFNRSLEFQNLKNQCSNIEKPGDLTKIYTIDCSAVESLKIIGSVGTLQIKNLLDIADFYLTLFTDSSVNFTSETSNFYCVLVINIFQEPILFSGNIDELREILQEKNDSKNNAIDYTEN